jgi:hypothetical protein
MIKFGITFISIFSILLLIANLSSGNNVFVSAQNSANSTFNSINLLPSDSVLTNTTSPSPVTNLHPIAMEIREIKASSLSQTNFPSNTTINQDLTNTNPIPSNSSVSNSSAFFGLNNTNPIPSNSSVSNSSASGLENTIPVVTSPPPSTTAVDKNGMTHVVLDSPNTGTSHSKNIKNDHHSTSSHKNTIHIVSVISRSDTKASEDNRKPSHDSSSNKSDKSGKGSDSSSNKSDKSGKGSDSSSNKSDKSGKGSDSSSNKSDKSGKGSDSSSKP